MKSFLEETIQELIPKAKITMKRLNEYGEELPSNIQPETPRDLISYSVRDLRSIMNGLKSHLRHMQQSRADERQILELEQQIDILDGTIDRLERASKMSFAANLDNPATRKQWQRQYGESFEDTDSRVKMLKQQIDNGEVPDVVIAEFSKGKNTTGDLVRMGYAVEKHEPSEFGKDLMSSWYEYVGPGKVKINDKYKSYILTATPKGSSEKNKTDAVMWWPT